jgi:hypothetical protein
VPFDDAGGLASLSCAADDTCVAVSRSGYLTTYGEPTPTATPTPTPTATATATATASATATPTTTPAATASPLPTASPVPGPSATPAPAAPLATLRSAKAGRRAVVATVRCAGDPQAQCALTFTLRAGSTTVGRANLTLRGGTSRTVTIKLNAAGRRRLKVKLKVQLKVATAQRTIATRRLTLR